MRNCFSVSAAAVLTVVLFAPASARGADSYVVDPVHSSVSFKIQHMGIAWIHGRFNEFGEKSGKCTIDKDTPANSSFVLTIKTDSVDTNNKQRDAHLRSPDFFNTKQFPLMSFKSTGVKAIEGGYELTGDLSLHGKTKSITFPLKGGKEATLMGKKRIGFSADLILKRSAFAMTKGAPMIGDEVHIAISFEAVKK